MGQHIGFVSTHLPFGLALTELIDETQIPSIARHHDFYWERTRFSVNAVGDYLLNMPSF